MQPGSFRIDLLIFGQLGFLLTRRGKPLLSGFGSNTFLSFLLFIFDEPAKSNKRFNDGIAVPLPDADAMRRIYKIVQRPKSIRAGAEKFVNEVIGTRNYLAVHWRFDDSSFGSKVQSICGSESKDDHVSLQIAKSKKCLTDFN